MKIICEPFLRSLTWYISQDLLVRTPKIHFNQCGRLCSHAFASTTFFVWGQSVVETVTSCPCADADQRRRRRSRRHICSADDTWTMYLKSVFEINHSFVLSYRVEPRAGHSRELLMRATIPVVFVS